jgi:ABC-type amino acid transport substrate-binding protein
MASLVITTQRAREVLFADSHLDETFAFLVPDHRRAEFSSIEKVRRIVPLRVAAPDLPGVLDLVEGMVPDAEVTTFESIDAIFSAANEFDAIVLTAERGSAWSLLHPEMSVVVPQPDPPRMPLAYSIAAHDERLRDFVNVWLELEAKGGTIGKLYSYWILGRDAEPRTPRWSVIRDVLHWVE